MQTLVESFWAVQFKEIITAVHLLTKNLLHKHGETEAASTVHNRLAGSRYMLVALWAHYHHITQYQPWGVGPKWTLDSSTPATTS